MKVAHLSEPAEARVIFRDGLGVRERRDTGTGELVEWFHLDPVFAGVEIPLRERVTRLAKFQHIKFARILGLEPARKDRGPILVSSHVPGSRLSDVLEMAGHGLVAFEPGAGLQILRDVLGALAVLHDSRNVTHGSLGPERVVLTHTGRVVMVEHVLGQALDRLQRPRHQLWRAWRVATPPAAGTVRFDMQTDFAQAGLLGLAVLLGRPIDEEEYPHRLRGLLPLVQDRLSRSPAAPIAADVVTLLERLAPVDGRRAFKTVRDAQQALEGLFAGGGAAFGASAARVKGVVAAAAAMAAVETPDASVIDAAQATGAIVVPAPVSSGTSTAETSPLPLPEPVSIEAEIDIDALLALEAELEGGSSPISPPTRAQRAAVSAPPVGSSDADAVPIVPVAPPGADGSRLGALAQERLDLERQFAELVASVAPRADDQAVHLILETPATSEPLVDARVLWSSMPVEDAADAIDSDTPAAALVRVVEAGFGVSGPGATRLREIAVASSLEVAGVSQDDEPVPFADTSVFSRLDLAASIGPISSVATEQARPTAAIDHVPADWWREALPWRDEGVLVAEPSEAVAEDRPAAESAPAVTTIDETDAPVVGSSFFDIPAVQHSGIANEEMEEGPRPAGAGECSVEASSELAAADDVPATAVPAIENADAVAEPEPASAPILLVRQDDEPAPTPTDAPFGAQPVDDAASLAVAALLTNDADGDAACDWRTALLGATTNADGTALPASRFFAGQTVAANPEREADPIAKLEPTAVPDSQPASDPPADTAPVEAPSRVEPPAMMPDIIPEVVIVDDGADGNAWDELPSERPVGTRAGDQVTEADLTEELSVPTSGEGQRASSEPVIVTPRSSSKKKRRRSRHRKGNTPDAMSTPTVVVAATATAVPTRREVAAVVVNAPDDMTSPVVVQVAPPLDAANTAASLVVPTMAISLTPPERHVASSADGTRSELASRQASLLGREVPVWTPPGDLPSLDRDLAASASPVAWTPPKLRAASSTGEFVADVVPLVTGLDIGATEIASAPVVIQAQAAIPAAPPALSSVGAPEALRPFGQDIRAVGMPDLDEHQSPGGRSNVLAMGEAIGSLTGSVGRSAGQTEPWLATPVAQPETSRGTKWRRFVAASVLIALFQGVAFAAWWWVQPGARGTLVVQTSRSGVEVLLDDKVVGRTPLREEVAPGRHTLGLRQGTNVREMPVEISVGVVTTQAIEWPSAIGGKGNLQVTSNPAGAEIVLGGKVRGTTPLLLEKLPAGDQVLTLRGDAGSVTVKATVMADETTPVEVKIFAGWILVDAPVEVNLLLDGREKIGSSMDGQILLPPGTHRVRAVNEALGIRQWLTVLVEPGAVKRVSVSVPPGTLTSEDEGEVFLDGALVGTTPGSISIAPGTHEIVLRLADGTERRQAMTVRAGQRVEF